MLKKDVKKITMERDGALKHLSLTTGIYVLTLLHSQIYSISLVTLIATFSTKLVCMYTCAFLFVCWGRPVTSREIWFLYYTRSILCIVQQQPPLFTTCTFRWKVCPWKLRSIQSQHDLFFFSGNMELGGHHHHRTASDTASGTSSTSAKPGNVHQISFSFSSILASRDPFSLYIGEVSNRTFSSNGEISNYWQQIWSTHFGQKSLFGWQIQKAQRFYITVICTTRSLAVRDI